LIDEIEKDLINNGKFISVFR